jgi:hypothetical protein
MSFLRKQPTKVKAEITLTIELDSNKTELIKTALEKIVSNCSQDDIILLGKLATDNLRRPFALASLRKEFN